LAGLSLAPIAAAPATLLLQGSALAIGWAQDWAALLVTWPPLQGHYCYLSPPPLVGAGLLVLALLTALGRRPHRRWAAGLAGPGLVLCLLPAPVSPGLTVTAISVGQGEAILVSLDDGRHLLVDGGGVRDPWFDVGERLTAPALGALGVRQLAAVVLSHHHPDHSQGLRQVLAAFPIGEIWLGPGSEPLPPELATVITTRGIPIRRFEAGWHTPWPDREQPLALFAPPITLASVNDRSLVLYAGLGRDGVLLTGDLEAAGLAALLEVPSPGPVTLLKLPHHGSWHSDPRHLLTQPDLQQVFVSAGRDNPYRLPDARTVAAVTERGLPLWRTDRDGTLRFITRGHGWQPTHWENGLFH
jgi:competence protein ComEC